MLKLRENIKKLFVQEESQILSSILYCLLKWSDQHSYHNGKESVKRKTTCTVYKVEKIFIVCANYVLKKRKYIKKRIDLSKFWKKLFRVWWVTF